MSAVLLDIDNCISNDAWRIPHINWGKRGDERYHDYHTLAPFDTPGNLHLVRDALRQDVRLFFLTARPVSYHAATREWLGRVVELAPGQYTVIMRNRDDPRPSVEVKRQQIHWLTELHGLRLNEVIGAYDDHAGIVEMYKSLGIPAQRVAIHDVCAYTNPLENKYVG